MIDLHCHILPNVDDGSSSIEETKQMLLEAIKDNTSDICITPHYSRIDNYVCNASELKDEFHKLQKQLSDLSINLYLGNELMIDSNLDDLLILNKVLTINNTSYVLIEFPFGEYKNEYDEYLYNISMSGYKVIIAHPERYKYVLDDYKTYFKKWLDNKYLIQCNTSSLSDHRLKKLVFKLIEQGYVHLMASDGHNLSRGLSMREANELISKKFNKDIAAYLFTINPSLVLQDKNVVKLEACKRRLF